MTNVLTTTRAASALELPTVVAAAGERASRRFVEFFTANIRNPNTRAAYARAVGDFFTWLEERGVTLERVEPVSSSATCSSPTVSMR